MFHKFQALEMIEDIRVAVNEILGEVEWMDEETQIVAQEKVFLKSSYGILNIQIIISNF